MASFKVIKDICYNSDRDERNGFDLYLPEGKESFPLLIFFYGGGMEGGTKTSPAMTGIGEDFAKEGIAVALPDYRLYPEIKFPVFIEDIANSVSYIKEHIKDYGNCTDVFVGGHSAGAYLSMMMTYNKEYLKPYNLSADDFSGFLFASGQPTTHFNILKERGIDQKKVTIDDAAPLYYADRQYPPQLILCAENDIANRLPQLNLLVSTLKEFAPEGIVEYHVLQGHDHGSYIHRGKSGHSVLCNIGSEFIYSNLKNTENQDNKL